MKLDLDEIVVKLNLKLRWLRTCKDDQVNIKWALGTPSKNYLNNDKIGGLIDWKLHHKDFVLLT